MKEPLLPNSRRDRSRQKLGAITVSINLLAAWQPDTCDPIILEQPKGVNENAEDTKKNQEQEAAGQSAGFKAREGGEG